MSETKKEFKWFWAWEDEKEEDWLNAQAQQGWHLQAPGTLGNYVFDRGEARDVVYRLDFKASGQDMDAYLQIFEDAGWEHLGAMGGWQYFRKERVEDEAAEIFTDNASKIQKYQRIIMYLVIFTPFSVLLLINLGSQMSFSGFLAGFATVVSIIASLFVFLYAYAMIRIIGRINELKR